MSGPELRTVVLEFGRDGLSIATQDQHGRIVVLSSIPDAGAPVVEGSDEATALVNAVWSAACRAVFARGCEAA